MTVRKPLVLGSDGLPQQLQAGDALSNAIVLSAGTQLATSGTAIFSNSNGVSFGLSNSSVVTASVAAGATATGNFGALAAGTQTATSGTVVASNSNNISFGLSGSSRLTASYAFNVSAGTTSGDVNAVTLANANGVSFGLNASTVTASVAAGATATGNFGAFAAGTQTATSGTVVASNSNNITFGMSGSSRLTASYAFNVSAGTTSNDLNAATFGNANGVSFGLNASTVTASVAAGATATGNFGALAAGTQTATSGTIVASNSNNISFGLSGSSRLTASYNFNVSAGTTSGNVNAVTFANGNGVTFGYDAGTVTASVAPGGGGGIAFAAGTQTGTSGTIVASNSNNISFGLSGSTRLTASYNFNVSAGTTSGNVNAVTFANGNGVTFGYDAGTVTASVSPGGGGGVALAAGTQTGTSGTIQFVDSNGLSFGMSGSSQITASFGGLRRFIDGAGDNIIPDSDGVIGLVDTHGVSFRVSGGPGSPNMYASVGAGATATGNLGALAAGTQTGTSGTIVVSNSNNISFGLSGSSRLTASYNFNVSAGTTSGNVNAITFGNGNGVTFGYNAGTVTASVAGGGGGGGVALAAGTQTGTSGTIEFADSNGISFGMSGSSQITVSSDAVRTLVDGNGQSMIPSGNALEFVNNPDNGISFLGVNGSQLRIEVSPLTQFIPYKGPWNVFAPGQGSLQVHPMPLEYPIAFDRYIAFLSNSNATNSSGSHTVSLWIGIYSKSNSSLSLIKSASRSLAATHSGTVGSYSLYSGLRQVSFGMTTTLAPGNYWFAYLFRTTSGGANGSYLLRCLSTANSAYAGIWSSAVSNSLQMELGLGVYSATTSAMPASIAFSQLSGTNQTQTRFLYGNFMSGTI